MDMLLCSKYQSQAHNACFIKDRFIVKELFFGSVSNQTSYIPHPIDPSPTINS